MTEEQKQMVLDNIGLVFLSIKQLNLKVTDDYIQIGSIGLIKGVKNFDESKGYKLSSYLTRCIKNEIIAEYNSSLCMKRQSDLNAISIYDEATEGIMIIDTLYSPVNVEHEVLFKMEMEKVCESMKVLKPKYKEILEYRYGLNGKPQLESDEISVMYGVTRQCIDEKLRRIYKKIRDEMNEKNNKKNKNKNTK